MDNISTAVDLMIFEAGSLIDLLSSKEQGADLADRIFEGAEHALQSSQTHFSLELSPVEVGMALSAASSSDSVLAQTVADKVKHALAAKLQELGISLDGSQQGGSLGDSPSSEPLSDGSGEQPSADEPPAEQPEDGDAL